MHYFPVEFVAPVPSFLLPVLFQFPYEDRMKTASDRAAKAVVDGLESCFYALTIQGKVYFLRIYNA
jgi:hypothetical protein